MKRGKCPSFFISHKLSCTFTAQILGRVVLIFSVLTKLNFGFCSYHITKTALLWEMMQWTYFHSPIPGSPINIWHCWSILSFFKLFPPLSSMIPGNLFLWFFLCVISMDLPHTLTQVQWFSQGGILYTSHFLIQMITPSTYPFMLEGKRALLLVTLGYSMKLFTFHTLSKIPFVIKPSFQFFEYSVHFQMGPRLKQWFTLKYNIVIVFID